MKILKWRLFDIIVQVLLFAMFIGLSLNFKMKIAVSFYVVSGLVTQTLSHFFLYLKARNSATTWRVKFHKLFKLEVVLFTIGVLILIFGNLINNWFVYFTWSAWAIVSLIIACFFVYFFVSLREFFVSKQMVEQSEIVDLGV